MVSLWLRYHIWLVGDSVVSLWITASADDVDYDGPEDERKRWTYLGLILWLARLYSLVRLGQWLQASLPSLFVIEWPTTNVQTWLTDFLWFVHRVRERVRDMGVTV